MDTFFKRYPISVWPLLLAVCLLILAMGGESVQYALRLESTAVLNGQWWRLLTAHWVHLGWPHTLLNCAGFLLLAWLQPKGAWWLWLIFYGVASLLISAQFMFDQQLSSYVGASGVLHGLLILAAFLSQWLEAWRRYLMVVLITVKLIWEQTPWYSDESIGGLIGGHVAVHAHLIGGLCGLTVVIFILYQYRQKSN
jgi:rhomboid family GlyGly-CTERM serine protease